MSTAAAAGGELMTFCAVSRTFSLLTVIGIAKRRSQESLTLRVAWGTVNTSRWISIQDIVPMADQEGVSWRIHFDKQTADWLYSFALSPISSVRIIQHPWPNVNPCVSNTVKGYRRRYESDRPYTICCSSIIVTYRLSCFVHSKYSSSCN